MANATYGVLPFSYLTGGSAPENAPTYGVKTSVSNEEDLQGSSNIAGGSDQDPYSIFAGKPPPESRPQHAPVGRVTSMDITDPQLDVRDPYLLGRGGRSADSKLSSTSSHQELVTNDPRYRDSVPSESDGGNVFFRASDSADNGLLTSPGGPRAGHQRDPQPQGVGGGGYANPALDAGSLLREDLANDTDARLGGKKLPRYRVDSDLNNYQYYQGTKERSGRGDTDKGMDTATNPVWDKYYAGASTSPPPGAAERPMGGSYGDRSGGGSYPSAGSPTSPGIRPTTKADDFNTLLRHDAANYESRRSRHRDGGSCCQTRSGALALAIALTALICLGGGFAAGWFIHEAMGPTTTTANTTTAAVTPGTTAAMVGPSETVMSSSREAASSSVPMAPVTSGSTAAATTTTQSPTTTTSTSQTTESTSPSSDSETTTAADSVTTT